MKVLLSAVLGACVVVVPVAVGAQAQQQPQVTPVNPNQVICERQEVTGSRLGHRKVCMTRSQWEDARRQDRGEIEKVQTQRGLVSEGHNGG